MATTVKGRLVETNQKDEYLEKTLFEKQQKFIKKNIKPFKNISFSAGR